MAEWALKAARKLERNGLCVGMMADVVLVLKEEKIQSGEDIAGSVKRIGMGCRLVL